MSTVVLRDGPRMLRFGHNVSFSARRRPVLVHGVVFVDEQGAVPAGLVAQGRLHVPRSLQQGCDVCLFRDATE